MSLGSSPHNSDRVLVTGATSYLGSQLVGRLLDDERQVHVVVRSSSDLSRLGPHADNLTIHEHDGSTENLLGVLENSKPDVVCHLATHYLRDHIPDQIASLVSANVLFGTQLLEAMQHVGTRRLISPATFFQFFDSDEYRPVNLYAATKQAFEDVLAYYVDAHGIEATTLVLYDIYGPGDWRKKLMAAIAEAQDTGASLPLVSADMVLDLVYVSDVVDAFMHAMDNNIVGGPYAVSSGTRHTLAEVITVFEAVGSGAIDCTWGAFPVPARNPAEPWSGPALPGWQARVSLKEGIRKFLDQGGSDAN